MYFGNWKILKQEKTLNFSMANGRMVGSFNRAGELTATGSSSGSAIGYMYGVWKSPY
jgi:hypothetical protein